MDADGWSWMSMDAMGGMLTGGNKNKEKRSLNGWAGHVFGCMVKWKKCDMLSEMVVVRIEDEWDEQRGSEGVIVQSMC